MIVEKPEILKQWMTETMEPLCDAEPGKLAKYVLALIKKDMPPQQLRESMKNNLDIFLHDQAAPFVDRLFETLETKSYMPQASPDSTTQAAAGVSGTAAAPVPADSARRRVTEPEGTGRGRGDRRPSSSLTGRRRPASEAERVPEPGSAVSDLRQKLNASGASGKQRCRDYDEKGYCMRGDQCPYDHGLDPVILNDVSAAAARRPQVHPAAAGLRKPYNPDAPSLTVTAPAPVPVPGWLPLANYSRPPPPHVRPYYPAAPAPVTAARQLLSVQVQGPPAAAAPAGPVPVGPRPRHPYTAAERGWAGRDPVSRPAGEDGGGGRGGRPGLARIP
ncbi:RNA-binding protein 26 [Amphibalanus amphitrite]|uniref:RNA-binding protein 26 n=1 Tax=Amphibalanus amphitrite TaxID=1232801 RepID=A0A6A4WMJ0_AMPAM|nr:RNA-binding protein 26 [Amphibalanus amphitrite]